MQSNAQYILWATLPLPLQMMDVPAEVALQKPPKKQTNKKNPTKKQNRRKALPAIDTLVLSLMK